MPDIKTAFEGPWFSARHKKTGQSPGFLLTIAPDLQRITWPLELMIVISTNFEPTWLDGEKLTLKPPRS